MDGLSIDLGTANTVVWEHGDGQLFNEPTMMALRLDGGRHSEVIAIGSAAEELVGRAPDGVDVIRPVRDGVITDLETTRRFLREILHGIAPTWLQRRRLSVVIGVPAGATALERRALLEAAEEAGIGKAQLLPEPVCGAVGCGIDPLQPRTHLVVDIGGGTSEVAAFGSGGVLTYRSTPVAGDEMTLALYRYIRNEHQLVVGELMAEEVKIRASTEPTPTMVVEGRDAATARPRVINLSAEEVADAVAPVTHDIFSALAGCLEDLPPQSVTDVMAEGVVVVGGGSLVPGFAKRLEDAFGFAVLMAEDPLTRVAEGAARCLDNRDALAAYALG
ncbi:MAG TPA: rod shape-determining protein MreB [Acidimicrobiia bacterium]|nr:rod shape-determining protein MreB [Acidimicrobiia bacterium]